MRQTTTKFQELLNNLDVLGLSKMHAYLPEYINQINGQQLSFTDAMLELTNTELAWTQSQQVERIIKRARFSQAKTLRAFDFNL